VPVEHRPLVGGQPPVESMAAPAVRVGAMVEQEADSADQALGGRVPRCLPHQLGRRGVAGSQPLVPRTAVAGAEAVGQQQLEEGGVVPRLVSWTAVVDRLAVVGVGAGCG
jgi:hypothetical protein